VIDRMVVASSNPAHDEVYLIQHYVINMPVTCSRSVLSPGTLVQGGLEALKFTQMCPRFLCRPTAFMDLL
jgi:hypothetical protein